MKDKITALLLQTIDASQRSDAHWLLPYVIKSLQAMQNSFAEGSLDPECLLRNAGGLGRIVTDDFAFSESPLGTKLLDLITEIVSRYDSAWPYN